MTEPVTDEPYTANGDAALVQALPGLARIASAAWLRTAEWSITTSLRAWRRVLRAAARGESPAELFADARQEVRDYLRALLEIVDSQEDAPSANGRPPRPEPEARTADSAAALRERGAELLRRSADVHEAEDTHPAYDRILTELAPDEGRILRLLSTQGPQPAVDVRTAGALGIGSEMVSPGLNMLGAEAGCRRLDSVHAYLNNLYRLGLVWFSREQLSDQARYQVLEAQPEVIEALEAAGRGKTIRRSITLTPFGEDFCDTCLPLHTDELEALPREPGDPPPSASEGAA